MWIGIGLQCMYIAKNPDFNFVLYTGFIHMHFSDLSNKPTLEVGKKTFQQASLIYSYTLWMPTMYVCVCAWYIADICLHPYICT